MHEKIQPIGRVLVHFYPGDFFLISLKRIQVLLKSEKGSHTFHENLRIFVYRCLRDKYKKYGKDLEEKETSDGLNKMWRYIDGFRMQDI
jgi:hypothetical protein